jgi:RNA polymerase sigma-70 factor (ECF subfamily)
MDRPDEQEPSDEALVAAAREGRRSALDALLRRHEDRVLRVLRLLGVPRIDREDVAQEVFIRVFRHLGSYRSGNPFSGWIYRIAVNAAHDHRRRARAREHREVELSPALERTIEDRTAPGAGIERGDDRRSLERALAALSERERAVFVLREVEGLETVEVAQALRITRITVRRHLGRARRHLQEALGRASAGEKTDGD